MGKEELIRENKDLKAELATLKTERDELRRLLFGAKRERFVPDAPANQGRLFGDGEENPVEAAAEPEKAVSPKPAKKRKPAERNVFPASLPRDTETLEPLTEEGKEYRKIGEDVTERLAYVPATLRVKRIVRPRYALPSEPDAGILQAPAPPSLVGGGIVDESLIAGLIAEKVLYHTPVHRFGKKMKRAGIDFLKNNNLYNWFAAGAAALFPLYHLLREEVMSSGYVQADETTIPVLSKNKKGSAHRGYMWAAHSPLIRGVVFRYDASRGQAAADALMEGYTGIVQSDGYAAYEKIGDKTGVILIHCMAHTRRKFFEAKDHDPERCGYFLQRVGELYALERKAREENLDRDARLAIREKHAVPILGELGEWLKAQYLDKSLLPKDPVRKAVEYAFKRWKGLSAYAGDGKLEIDNNLVENTIRPVALGRKNYMFAGSDEGAENLAVLYSLVGTCELNGIDAFKYLDWVLRKIAAEKVTPQAVEWLPHRVDKELFK